MGYSHYWDSQNIATIRIYEIFTIAFYIFHGIAITFSLPVIQSFYLSDLILAIVGGVLYIIGGIILGLERPDPFPRTFGFHEVFHLLTLLANSCFGLIIFKSYFLRR